MYELYELKLLLQSRNYLGWKNGANLLSGITTEHVFRTRKDIQCRGTQGCHILYISGPTKTNITFAYLFDLF